MACPSSMASDRKPPELTPSTTFDNISFTSCRSQAVGAGMATYELGATEGQESGSPFNTLARISNLIQTFRPSSGLQHQNKQEPQRTKPTTKGDGCAPLCGVAGPAKLGMLVSLMLNPDFHFSFGSANHRVASDAFIYAGSKALKALRRSTPNG